MSIQSLPDSISPSSESQIGTFPKVGLNGRDILTGNCTPIGLGARLTPDILHLFLKAYSEDFEMNCKLIVAGIFSCHFPSVQAALDWYLYDFCPSQRSDWVKKFLDERKYTNVRYGKWLDIDWISFQATMKPYELRPGEKVVRPRALSHARVSSLSIASD